MPKRYREESEFDPPEDSNKRQKIENTGQQLYMAGKRKRSYSRRSYRPYKRRRGASVRAIVRAMERAKQPVGPFGIETSSHYQKYGPSRAQMMKVPGLARSSVQSYNRMMDNYWGPGDYWEDAEKGALAGAGIGGMVGAGLGAEVTLPFMGAGAVPGAVAGSAIGAGIGGLTGLTTGLYNQYFGKGDYTSVNQIAGGGEVISVNKSNRTGDIFIEQTEFIGNLTASNPLQTGSSTAWQSGKTSSQFSIESYDINPGLDKLFPFLSQIAANYELYEWEGLMLKYVPNSGETSVMSNQLGKVIFATNYDPDAMPFRTSVEMQNYDYANSAKPSVPIVHGVETARFSKASNMLYVRDGNSTKDRVLTDIGRVFIATEGIPIDAGTTTASPTTVVLGELHVTYRIRLSRAKLYQSLLGFGISSDRFIQDRANAYTVSTRWLFSTTHGVSPSTPLSTNKGVWDVVDDLTSHITVQAGQQLVAGCFKWSLFVRCVNAAADTAASITSVTASNNCSVVKQTDSSGNEVDFISSDPMAAGAGTRKYMASGYFTVNNPTDLKPRMTLHMNQNTGTTRTAIYVKLSITQVSCKLQEVVY